MKYVFVFIVAFLLGGLVFKFKPFPYPQIADKAKQIKKALANRSIEPSREIAKQYVRDFGPSHEKRTIDTALLPLSLSSIYVSATQDFPKGVGSITVVDDALVLMDRLGGIYLFEDGKIIKRTFPTLPNNMSSFIRFEGSDAPVKLRAHDIEYIKGIHSLAVSHERFDTNQKHPQMAVSIIEIDSKTLHPKGEWRTIYNSNSMPASRYASLAGGGRLVVKGKDKLLLTIGDYNQDTVMIESTKVSQDSRGSFGKIFEIDYVSGKNRLLSLGHRNPQGLMVTMDGEIFATEHGPAGGDELNRISEGANFGWPNVTLGTDYGTYNWPLDKLPGRHEGYILPTFAWVPSIGVSNILQVRNFNRSWDGDFLVASLKASSLFRLRMDGMRVVYSEPIWIGNRIRDIVQMKSGTIVLWTDEARLIFIDVDHGKLHQNARGLGFLGQQELSICMTCHHFDVTGPTHLAPSLGNIVGREIASDGFTKYSPSLKAKKGAWQPDRLKEFIANPEAFAPGTTMPKLDLRPADIDRIVEVLQNRRKGEQAPP